jgi:hypothetical protein
MFNILESLGENVYFGKRARMSNFFLKWFKGFYLVMAQTQKHIKSSTNPQDVLKFHVMLCLMRLMVLK